MSTPKRQHSDGTEAEAEIAQRPVKRRTSGSTIVSPSAVLSARLAAVVSQPLGYESIALLTYCCSLFLPPAADAGVAAVVQREH